MNILYSTGCPRCKVLKQKLEEADIDYEIVEDKDEILSKGIRIVPVLEVDGELLNFKDALRWITRKEE